VYLCRIGEMYGDAKLRPCRAYHLWVWKLYDLIPYELLELSMKMTHLRTCVSACGVGEWKTYWQI
jgi:hypothetical protein